MTATAAFFPSAPLEGETTYLATVNTGARSDAGVPLAADVSWSFSVPPLLAIQTVSLPDGFVGVPYSYTLQAAGGQPPYAWTIVSGRLPRGITLQNSGLLSGTTTFAGVKTLTFQVEDSAAAVRTVVLTLTIREPLSITTSGLPSGRLGQAYSATLAATGGTAPYAWSIVSGSLPSDLSLQAATGVISGTPTTRGTWDFTVGATDVANETVTKALSIRIH